MKILHYIGVGVLVDGGGKWENAACEGLLCSPVCIPKFGKCATKLKNKNKATRKFFPSCCQFVLILN